MPAAKCHPYPKSLVDEGSLKRRARHPGVRPYGNAYSWTVYDRAPGEYVRFFWRAFEAAMACWREAGEIAVMKT